MKPTTSLSALSAIRTGTALAVVISALAGLTPAYAQSVIVQGNQRVDAETVRSYFKGAGAGSVDQGRKDLLASGLFSDVRVSRRGGDIVVSVRENNVINRVVFEGNRRVNKEALEAEVQAKPRGPYSSQLVEADVQRIREIYQRVGRSQAKVSSRVVDLPNGRIDVVYTVEEGDKTGVKELNFVGNNVFSASRLRGLMTTTEMNFLSWLKNSDVYDPDRIAADQELIRRYYLKNGYADFRIVSTDATYDEAKGGYIITMTVEEGEQYRVSDVRIDSRFPDVDPEVLRRQAVTTSGSVYNAEDVEKTQQNITNEIAKRGYAFSQVRPQGNRDPATRSVAITYVVEEGPRVYIERINVRGNSRTRDYVIRRELDLGEGDAYNKVLIDRGERRLNNLGYFKRVRITNEPGSSPDRVVVNIDVEDQPTGSFSVAGGYSTSDGFIGEVSVTESNFLGRGQFVRLAGTTGQRAQGIDFSFTEPYFLGQRLAFGVDLFSRYSDNTNTARYEVRSTGGQLRLGLPITEELGVTFRYSLFEQQLKVPNTVSKPFNDCSASITGVTPLNGDGTSRFPDCAFNGEASVAVKEAAGRTTTSLVGATLAYNTLDNIKDPRSGYVVELRPDLAGLGGDSKYVRGVAEARAYRELYEDFVGMIRLQGGHIAAFGGDRLRIVDHFNMGPSLVRGFAAGGIGPRDVTSDPRGNALGGTTFLGATAEVQFPIFGIPRDLGLKGAVFADAGTLFGYKGSKAFDVNRNGLFDCDIGATAGTVSGGIRQLDAANPVQPECVNVRDSSKIRSSVGASLLWQSPLGPIRFDYAFALSKDSSDRTQAFRFSGGTRF